MQELLRSRHLAEERGAVTRFEAGDSDSAVTAVYVQILHLWRRGFAAGQPPAGLGLTILLNLPFGPLPALTDRLRSK